eukprot:jgi/Botrbrau1/9277/Bobra.0111s0005.1
MHVHVSSAGLARTPARSNHQDWWSGTSRSTFALSTTWRRPNTYLLLSVSRPSRAGRLAGVIVKSQQAEDTEAIEMEVKVSGMTCEGCSTRVQKALESLAGVEAAEVALDSGIARIHVAASGQLDAFYTQLPRLVDAIRQLGFDAEPHFGDYEED